MSPPVRETASQTIARILAEVLWIAERDGPTVAETAAHFGRDEEALLADLEVASMIGGGSDDYTDMPIEMFVEDGRIHVFLHAFDRPLRLTPAEALALVAAGAAVSSTAQDPGGALRRGLDKLASVLGIEVGEQIEIDLGVGDPETFRVIGEAVEQNRVVQIHHVRSSDDRPRTRAVEPWARFRDRGAWYLAGHCRDAGAPRTFRLDRIVAATLTDEVVAPPDPLPEVVALSTPVDAPRVVLDLAPSARWVIENHPVEETEVRPDGTIRASLVVVSVPWLERLLLRLGDQATVVDLDPALGPEHPGRRAARRILARYGEPGPDR